MSAFLTVDQLCKDVRELIVDSFLKDRGAAALTSDDDLLTVLNSLQLLRMVLELETRYAVSIGNNELTPENLGTVERVAGFIASKLN
jgi:acyl carrier protein